MQTWWFSLSPASSAASLRNYSAVWASSSPALQPASTRSHNDTVCQKYSFQAGVVRGCLQSYQYWPLGELTSEMEWITETDNHMTPCDLSIGKHFWRGQMQGRGSFCVSLFPELQRWETSIFLTMASVASSWTLGQGGRTPPSSHRLFFCSHFSPPLLKLWCFSGMEECNEMIPKEMIHFLSPPHHQRMINDAVLLQKDRFLLEQPLWDE